MERKTTECLERTYEGVAILDRKGETSGGF